MPASTFAQLHKTPSLLFVLAVVETLYGSLPRDDEVVDLPEAWKLGRGYTQYCIVC